MHHPSPFLLWLPPPLSPDPGGMGNGCHVCPLPAHTHPHRYRQTLSLSMSLCLCYNQRGTAVARVIQGWGDHSWRMAEELEVTSVVIIRQRWPAMEHSHWFLCHTGWKFMDEIYFRNRWKISKLPGTRLGIIVMILARLCFYVWKLINSEIFIDCQVCLGGFWFPNMETWLKFK